jgi:hypothetical protein
MYDEFAATSLPSLMSQDLVLETDIPQQDSIRHTLFDLEPTKTCHWTVLYRRVGLTGL